VAVKTGTSQGFRDAWTVAWSGRFLVAAWVGRADAGPMSALGGAGSAAELARALLLDLHGTQPGDLSDARFAIPGGTAPASLCAAPMPAAGRCGHRLQEFVPPGAKAIAEAMPLAITVPAADSRIWRNPDSPAATDRLVLRARAPEGVQQVVWYVDGAPFALADPAQPVSWPLAPGAHRFQIGLPLRPDRSRPVRVVVE
jgi:penicillin-binding protein 1C